MLVDDLESDHPPVASSLFFLFLQTFPEPGPGPEGPRAEDVGEGPASEAADDVKVGERAGAQAVVVFFVVVFFLSLSLSL